MQLVLPSSCADVMSLPEHTVSLVDGMVAEQQATDIMGGMVMTQQAPAMSQHQEPHMYSFKGDSLQMGTTPPQHALEGGEHQSIAYPLLLSMVRVVGSEEISSSTTPDRLSSCQTTTADEVTQQREIYSDLICAVLVFIRLRCCDCSSLEAICSMLRKLKI